MPWPVDLTLMVRSLIGDLDKTKYTDERIKQILVVGAYNVNNDADFNNAFQGLSIKSLTFLISKIINFLDSLAVKF